MYICKVSKGDLEFRKVGMPTTGKYGSFPSTWQSVLWQKIVKKEGMTWVMMLQIGFKVHLLLFLTSECIVVCWEQLHIAIYRVVASSVDARWMALASKPCAVPHVRARKKKEKGKYKPSFSEGKRNPLILLVCRRNINDHEEKEYAC